jgi:hypothetical protein
MEVRMKPKRDQQLLVQVTAAEKAALQQAAAAADLPASQLVRRGIVWAMKWARSMSEATKKP